MLRARLIIFACVMTGSAIVSAQPGVTGALTPPRSPRNASYTITARLDPSTRTITGSEVITWRNVSATAATDLQFHLYWNAWKNTRSTFMRERVLSDGADTGSRSPGEWSRIDVAAVTVDGVDRTSSKRFIAPDDGNPDDETVMSVPLAQAIAPDGSATIEVSWTAHVPRTFARTGAVGNFFFIAQWFPKLGVLQDDGWNCHQFHAGTEFFSDFGVYDVALTVPSGWPLGATGVQRERKDNDDRTTTHRYYQEDVHDFAWTTSPDYRAVRSR